MIYKKTKIKMFLNASETEINEFIEDIYVVTVNTNVTNGGNIYITIHYFE
jgi:hypothetical protein